jgi:ABC-2 type transport system ATP-binding protein
MTTEYVISTQTLTRRFGETVAVDALTLDVRRGEIFGLLGHNGAGKTTTVRLLNGVLHPDGGTIRVLDRDPVTEGAALRRETGVLTETPSLSERLTGRENLTITAALYGVERHAVAKRVAALLTTFALEDRADDLVGGYSKGMKQRLALARALLHRPPLLFLDEPTGGLDPVAARQVRRMIRQQSEREAHTVVLCTHNLAEAQDLCDRVAVLEHGRLVALGTPTALARDLGHGVQLAIEVAPDQEDRAARALNALSGIAEITADDARLTVKLHAREAIPEVIETLVDAGVRLYGVTPQEPTLEDVYFALHDDEEEMIV